MDYAAKWTLLMHSAATLAMVGVIWFVQIVHYPLMSQVGRDNFRRYELDHQRLTAWVVGPLMLTELATAIALLWFRPLDMGLTPVWIGLITLASIWFVTYSIQVPQHAALVLAYDPSLQQRLVTGNWIRTVAWTARGVLALWMVSQAFPGLTTEDSTAQIATNIPR